MPRNVRNFWIELEVDGKKHKVATGPRRSDGGFTMTIKVRENGEVSNRRIYISGKTDGEINVVTIETPDGSIEHIFSER